MRELIISDSLYEKIKNSYFPFQDFLTGLYEMDREWDNWIEDMTHLAETYPHYTFIIDGDDGDDGKMWRTYFRGDKMFTADAHVVYDIPEWYEED